jgi:hypothetical protein
VTLHSSCHHPEDVHGNGNVGGGWLLRAANQASGGARIATDDRTTERTGPVPSSTTALIAMERFGITISVGTAAAVGDVRLRSRSSKSSLSERPLGPLASIGIV